MRQVAARVISNRQLLSFPGARYFLLRMEAKGIAAASKPGQFLMVKCGGDTTLRRPLSVHSVIAPDELELLYAVPVELGTLPAMPRFHGRESEPRSAMGVGTSWLSRLTEGAPLDIVGPLGNGYSIEPSANKLLLVAGGIGIAPLRFLAEVALLSKNVTLLLGARLAEGLFPRHLLPVGLNLVTAVEECTDGTGCKVVDLVPKHVEWADQVFACGPQAMYEALNSQAERWPKQPPTQVSLETRMGCGTGACYSCSIKTRNGMKRVCKEGPVFDIKDIIWQEVRT